MSGTRGCLKNGCFGCLGLLGLLIVVLAVFAGLAWKNSGDRRLVARDLGATPADSLAAPALRPGPGAPHAGTVVLELAHGEFELMPGRPGEGVHARASFDEAVYHVEDEYVLHPDSTWTYRVSAYRTISGMEALFRQVFGAGHDPRVEVVLPPDVPIALLVKLDSGGCEAELGGLWLTDADLRFSKGGFAVAVSEPLREPMGALTVRGAMGGFDASRLGNCSPRVLDVACRMGGAQIDLKGRWLNDADVRTSVRMGGMSVLVPHDVVIEGTDLVEPVLQPADLETPWPVLRLHVEMSMGEVEISR